MCIFRPIKDCLETDKIDCKMCVSTRWTLKIVGNTLRNMLKHQLKQGAYSRRSIKDL